jgi:hypothetical protein
MPSLTKLSLYPVAALLLACGSDSTGPGGDTEFVIRGSGSATAASLAGLNVDPATFTVGFFEIRLSTNANCSGPYVTVMTASPARRVDMTTDPEIVRVTGLPDGDYSCLAMRISDLLQFTPASTEGGCIGGTPFTHDTYRVDNETTPFDDIDGNPITAHGSDAAPVEDAIWAFASTNMASVTARGFNENQVIPLTTALHVPGSTTFYWDASNGLQSTGTGCEVGAGEIGFR